MACTLIRLRWFIIVVAAAWATVFLEIPDPARAEAEEFPTYTEQAEPICYAFTQHGGKLLQGIKVRLKQKDVYFTSRKLQQAGLDLRKTTNELMILREPPFDTTRLAIWFRYLKRSAIILERAGHTLMGHQKRSVALKLITSIHSGPRVDNAISMFHFHYCRLTEL
jgi:hypothetical protein